MHERTCTGRGYGMREFECTPIELRAKSFLIPEIARGVEILSTRVQGKLRGCETSWDKEGGEGWRRVEMRVGEAEEGWRSRALISLGTELEETGEVFKHASVMRQGNS